MMQNQEQQRRQANQALGDNSPAPKRAGLLSIISSVAAAMIGVQSDKNRRFDFQQSSMWPYIAVGVVFTVGLVLALVAIVNLVLA